MRIVIYISLGFFAAMSIWQIIFDEVKHQQENATSSITYSGLCHTWYFVVSNLFMAVAAGFFIYIGHRVSKTVE